MSGHRDAVIGAVLLGGESRRFGRDKALAPVGSTTMGRLVVDALRDAGIDPVVGVGGTAGGSLGVPTVEDRWPGQGPLAAVATVLLWARTGHVVIANCDLPALRADDVGRLVDAAVAQPDQGSRASVDGRPEVQLLCAPAGLGPDVRNLVAAGERRMLPLFDLGRWVEVEVDPRSVSDADTPDDLAAITGADSTSEG